MSAHFVRDRPLFYFIWRAACGRDSNLWCGSRTAGAIPFFVSPKKGIPKKGDPESARQPPSPNAFWGPRVPTLHPAAAGLSHASLRATPSGLFPKGIRARARSTGATAATPIWPLPDCHAGTAVTSDVVVPAGLRRSRSLDLVAWMKRRAISGPLLPDSTSFHPGYVALRLYPHSGGIGFGLKRSGVVFCRSFARQNRAESQTAV